MPDIVAKGSDPQHLSPVGLLEVIVDLRQKFADVVRNVGLVDRNIEDTSGKFHDPQRVLEAAMSGSWVDEVGQSQLVNVAKSLEGARIQHVAFVRRKADEHMNGIANFVKFSAHR